MLTAYSCYISKGSAGSAALEHFLESSPAEKAKREVLCCFGGKCFKGGKKIQNERNEGELYGGGKQKEERECTFIATS